jgi:Tol biopolymer transport system component
MQVTGPAREPGGQAPVSAPSAEAVRQALQEILTSDLFRNAKRQKRFLTFTVEQTLSGKTALLKETLLGVEVFDRKPGYDSESDNIVRVEARRVRSKLRAYYNNGARGSAVRIEYPLGSYVPVFAADIGESEQAAADTVVPPKQTPAAARKRWRSPSLAACAAGLTVLLVFQWNRSAPPIRTGRVRIVAHHADGGFVADSQRLYFVQRAGNQFTLAQTPAEGGPVIPIPSPFKEPTLFDISPDESQLLIGGGESGQSQSLWTISVAGGTPQRLGELMAGGAAWAPDGRVVAYTHGPQIFIANADGSNSRAIARFPGDWVTAPRWSPDQRSIRLTLVNAKQSSESLWEVAADGSNPHSLLPGWHADRSCCGTWVAGGRYFVFQAKVNGANNLWAMAEPRGLFRRRSEPFQLTAGPIGLALPFASRDGNRIFALNNSSSGELVSYDAAKDSIEPYMGGISASWCTFSRDGRYVAYSSYPEHSLWRSKVDGAEALQLTRPPLGVWANTWSPDGSRIAMMAVAPGGVSKIYVVPADGGKPEQIVDAPGEQASPSFSPDGKSILFGRAANDPSKPAPDNAVFTYDLESRKLSSIPGSKGLWSPAWSPNGRYIAAADMSHGNAMMLWDFENRRWKQILGPGNRHSPCWSSDSRYLVFESITDAEDAIYRVRVSDGHMEKIVNAGRFARADVSHSLFSGLTPQGVPLVMLFRNAFDVSALDLESR